MKHDAADYEDRALAALDNAHRTSIPAGEAAYYAARAQAFATLAQASAITNPLQRPTVPAPVVARLDTRCITWPVHPADGLPSSVDRCDDCDGCTAACWLADQGVT